MIGSNREWGEVSKRGWEHGGSEDIKSTTIFSGISRRKQAIQDRYADRKDEKTTKKTQFFKTNEAMMEKKNNAKESKVDESSLEIGRGKKRGGRTTGESRAKHEITKDREEGVKRG